jgi:polysaccharide chain length determinant protein (PEP-CTERM system associated)
MLLANRQYGIDDYLAMLRRRWLVLLIPAVIIPALTYAGSMFIPNRYTSQTLVLVEQPRVPEAYVKSATGDELGQRLSTMQEQILSRTRLQPIIERFGLYHNDIGKVPMEVLLERMRKNTSVKPVRGEFAARASGLPGFFISFTSDDARTAQQVCAQITSMFMDENLKVREQQAQGTTDFLHGQLTEAKSQLDDHDAKLAQFKEKYVSQLPGSEQTNLSMLASLNTRLEAVTQSVAQAQQQRTYLEALLAQQVAAYRQSSAARTDTASADELLKRREVLYSQLQDLEARYTPDHPDVIKAKNSIAKLDAEIARAQTAPVEARPTQKATGPEPREIQQLRLNVQAAADAVKAKTSERDHIQVDMRTYEARVQLSPKVEEEYKRLTRDYQSAQAFYDDLLKKSQQSEMSTDLERKQEGEQFRVMDPANLPERPTFPNRPLLAGGGFALGLALGIGLVILFEYRDKTLRSELDVLAALKLKTLAMMPDINEPLKKASWRERRQLKRTARPIATV